MQRALNNRIRSTHQVEHNHVTTTAQGQSSKPHEDSQMLKKGKSDEELIILRYHYLKSKHSQTKEKFNLQRICRETGFTKRQVYKWMWDEKKRERKSDDSELEDELWEIHKAKYKKIKKVKSRRTSFSLKTIHVNADLKKRIPKTVWKAIQRNLISMMRC